MAQWAHFGRARAPFYLYVPATAVDIARRLCTENQVGVSEIWSYHSIGDQTRFILVQRMNHQPPRPAAAPARPDAAPKKPAAKSAAKPAVKPKAKPRPKPKAAVAAAAKKKKPKRK
jgi:hypothetical protein